VDDDASVRVAMDGLVRSAGYRSVMFSSGAEFLARHRKYEVDCLVLDIELPGMDGLYVQRRLVAMNFSFPIIVVTGHDGEHREMAQKQAPLRYCLRPLTARLCSASSVPLYNVYANRSWSRPVWNSRTRRTITCRPEFRSPNRTV
jgi:CheY-like chemotaxis protein